MYIIVFINSCLRYELWKLHIFFYYFIDKLISSLNLNYCLLARRQNRFELVWFPSVRDILLRNNTGGLLEKDARIPGDVHRGQDADLHEALLSTILVPAPEHAP